MHILTYRDKKWWEKSTIYKHNWLFDGVLVAELRLQKGPADKRTVESWLVPTQMKMINVYMVQTYHNLHQILNYKRKDREMASGGEGMMLWFLNCTFCLTIIVSIIMWSSEQLFTWRIGHSHNKQQRHAKCLERESILEIKSCPFCFIVSLKTVKGNNSPANYYPAPGTERTLERTLSAPGTERALERTLSAPGTERALERTLSAPGMERALERTLSAPRTERALERTLSAPGTERALERTLSAPGTEQALERILSAPGTERALDRTLSWRLSRLNSELDWCTPPVNPRGANKASGTWRARLGLPKKTPWGRPSP